MGIIICDISRLQVKLEILFVLSFVFFIFLINMLYIEKFFYLQQVNLRVFEVSNYLKKVDSS